MKGPLDRTKVVLRHLPPSISQSSLMEQVDSRFSGRYNWFSFFPGKTSHNHQSYSRAYIDFKRADDVIEFAEFFDGHVFVNEKGTQFKTIVEYAPSQRVPKQWSKKDGREGTILKDPEYMEFLEFLSKPVENLPSAEIQLERKEAERAGAVKEAPIVTPLMDYVRQKRAAKSGVRRSVSNGKSAKRISRATESSSSNSSKRVSDKRRISTTTMYVLRDSSKGVSGKDKSAYVLVPKRDDQLLSDKSTSAATHGSGPGEEENGNSGKKKILLLKGKEKEIRHITGGSPIQQSTNAPAKTSPSSAVKQNQRREASGKIIRSILLKDNRQSSVIRSEQQSQASNMDKDRRPPRPPSVSLLQKDGNVDDKVHADFHGQHSEKQERRSRNKDRPDRVVWTPLRRSDGSHTSDESLSSSASQSVADSAEGAQLETRNEMPSGRSGESRHGGSGRGSYSSVDNGSYKHGGRRGSAHIKDSDDSSYLEGKPLRRAGSSGHYEKQVWVQKSSSGS
ncbi:OLC1v1038875C1 [Oldenlandia corymbosa var. corymbosa]|uniref:OLC1v1038875C1 n=1 Tax=Oldenlandia corymbosa var. corymbosa TaxID=529605 RepID=A0AAV1D4J0_OLDCO|nr:OLC1v1038875C1 [Oldenlandia corymbosa var. corymbosa]